VRFFARRKPFGREFAIYVQEFWQIVSATGSQRTQEAADGVPGIHSPRAAAHR
jgi:hypothetical protein